MRFRQHDDGYDLVPEVLLYHIGSLRRDFIQRVPFANRRDVPPYERQMDLRLRDSFVAASSRIYPS